MDVFLNIKQLWNASSVIAQGSRPLFTLIADVRRLIELLFPIAVALAVLFFIWGLAVFILHSGDEKSAEEGKRKMFWGVLALFVIVSIWGIVAFLGNVFGVGQGGTGAVPGVDTRAGGRGTAGNTINSGGGGSGIISGSTGNNFNTGPGNDTLNVNPAPQDIKDLPPDFFI